MRVIITGGTSDIAKAIAKRRSAMGDEIIITSSSKESLKANLAWYQSQDIDCNGFVFEFSDPQKSQSDLERELDHGVDSVVFNAFERLQKPVLFHETSHEANSSYLQKNVLGNLWFLHRVLPHMLQRQFGRLVLISSLSAATGTSHYGIYCAAKSALEGLMLNLAVDYSENGILSNIVRLGVFKTSRTALFWKRSEYREKMGKKIPQRNLGEPHQAAEALDPLLSPSAYITGSIITVGGGLPLLKNF